MISVKNAALISICLFIWVVRLLLAFPICDEDALCGQVGSRLTVRGTVTGEVTIKESSTEFYFHSAELAGAAQVKIFSVENFSHGDFVEVAGVLEKNFRSDPRIAGVFENARVILIRKHSGISLRKFLFLLKDKAQERLHGLLPEPAGSLAAGILFGARAAIPQHIKNDFKLTGLTHILAISGFNIVIIIAVAVRLFSLLPVKIGRAATLIFIMLFTLFTGASASVVRAAVMASLGIFGRIAGRRVNTLRLLFIAAWLMALHDPFIVIYDIGFQLSCAATLGLICVSPHLKKWLHFVPESFALREGLAATLSAQLTTLPFALFYFGGFSAIAPLANIAAAPFIPFLMLGSFLTLIFGIIVAYPTWLLFQLFVAIVSFFAEFSGAFIELGT